jgi:hypothetical protein
MNRVYAREEQSETSPNIEECGEQRLWVWRLHVVVGLRMHGCNTHTIDQLLLRSKCLRRCRGPGVRQMCERGARRMNEKFRAQNCQCDPPNLACFSLGACSLLHRQDRQLCDSVGAYILVRVRGLLHVSRLDSLVDLHRCFSPVELCAVCVGVCGCVCVCAVKFKRIRDMFCSGGG